MGLGLNHLIEFWCWPASVQTDGAGSRFVAWALQEYFPIRRDLHRFTEFDDVLFSILQLYQTSRTIIIAPRMMLDLNTLRMDSPGNDFVSNYVGLFRIALPSA